MIEIPQIERITENGQRYYTNGKFKYPSVTTVLGSFEDLSEWRSRVGDEAADKISRQSAVRGTLFHQQVEHYLRHKENPSYRTPLEQQLFINTKAILDRIDYIRLLETQLYSNHLRLAGTVDCVATFDGVFSVIDFKTAVRQKTASQIENYFQQAAAYAIMFEELTMIPVSQLVIVIAVEGAPSQVFKSKRDLHVKGLLSKRDSFEERRK